MGGIEGHINLLATGLENHGITVEVLVSHTLCKSRRETIDGIEVLKAFQLGRFSSAALNPSFPLWIRRLGSAADLLHFHFPNPTGELAYLISGLRRPFVVTYHSDIIRQKYLKKIYHPFLIQFLKRAHTIFATSPRYLESSPLLRRFRSKCAVLPLGIKWQSYSPALLENNAMPTPKISKRPVILFIGRFRYYKGLHILIEAMKGVRGQLRIIGGGPLKKELTQQVHRNGLEHKIMFLGDVPESEKLTQLHQCDLFVLPSIERSEAFGLVQLEAMACGKPVVSTELDTGTSYVNIHNKTGLVVKPKDPVALRQALNRLLGDPQLAHRMGAAGELRVRSVFSAEKMIRQVASHYLRIVNGK